MRVLLIHQSDGRIASKQTVKADWLRVGRSTSCEIHLPDPRVALSHGMVTFPDGFRYVEGEAGSQDITRKPVRLVRWSVGEAIEVGPYRLEMQEAPPGYDGQIQVELVRPLAARAGTGLAAGSRRLTLASLGLTRRWSAWALALLVLVFFLALPAGRVLHLPWEGASQSAVFGDRFWNPGRLLLAHQPIEQRCATCHEVAFEHVKDRACLECHGSVGRHVEAAVEPAALREDARCTSCHRDHKGLKATHRDDDGLCVNCHRDLRPQSPGATALDVSDFARDHPEFRLSVPAGEVVRRVRMGQGPVQAPSGLKFPHDVHLDPAGVKSPTRGRVNLGCGTCHAPDGAGRKTEPIAMARHCQECHTLQFEPAVTTREVPHGDPVDAMVVIEEFYANLALQGVADSFQKAFGVPGEGLLRRVGEPTVAERELALGVAQRKARKVGAELFEVRVCVTCHEVTREDAPRAATKWRIAPVRLHRDWMPGSRFDHKTHLQQECTTCHDVAASKSSREVAMPGVKACRDCHAGSKPVEGRVQSNCLLCHGFHDAKHPWTGVRGKVAHAP